MRKNTTYMALLGPTRLLISKKSDTYTIKWSCMIIWQVRVCRLLYNDSLEKLRFHGVRSNDASNSYRKHEANLKCLLNSIQNTWGMLWIVQLLPRVSKTFWKIESSNAISGIHLGGMAKKIFFLVTKLFCFSR